jgi:hypothetical protein
MKTESAPVKLREWVRVALAVLLTFTCIPQRCLAWGHEGHQVIALIAEHYMTGTAKAMATELLDGSSIEAVASWADDYRHGHPETAPWLYINCPLVNSSRVLARDVK